MSQTSSFYFIFFHPAPNKSTVIAAPASRTPDAIGSAWATPPTGPSLKGPATGGATVPQGWASAATVVTTTTAATTTTVTSALAGKSSAATVVRPSGGVPLGSADVTRLTRLLFGAGVAARWSASWLHQGLCFNDAEPLPYGLMQFKVCYMRLSILFFKFIYFFTKSNAS